MTRKDYIIIADAIIKMIRLGFVKKKDEAVTVMCDKLSSDNYKFDYDKFREYIEKGIK